LVLVSFSSHVVSATYISNSSGTWNTAATWQAGNTPQIPDYTGLSNLTINIYHQVTLDANLIINNGVTIHIFNGGRLTINGNVDINNNFEIYVDNGAYFEVNGNFSVKNNATGTISGTLDVSGNLTVTSGGGNGAIGGTGSVIVGGTYTDTGSIFSSGLIYGTTYYSWVNGGNWNSSSTWSSTSATLTSVSTIPANRNAATIQAGHTIHVNSLAQIKNLNIQNTASLIIDQGQTLEIGKTTGISGNFTNNGSLVINTLGTGGLNFDGNATGVVNLSITSKEYHYISSPLSNASSTPFDASGNYYQFNETNTNTDWNYSWEAVPGNMGIAKGYTLYDEFGNTYAFSGGSFNNGNITTPITNSNNGGGGNSWNLIGNPYPCNIDIAKFFETNLSTILQQTVYLWDDDGSSGTGYTSSDYSYYNVLGQTGGGNGTVVNGKIGIGQGFFVKAVNSGGNVQFNNAMKTSTSATFFKSQLKSTNSDISKLKLKISDEASVTSEIIVGFAEDALSGQDYQYDAERLILSQKLSFYSLIGSKFFAIQGLPTVTSEIIVPLGITANSISGKLTINKMELENMDVLLDVFLEDLVDNKIINLKTTNSYSFDQTSGTAVNNRFQLRFKLNANSFTRWIGADNADISIASNWDNGIPTNKSSVTIPSGKKINLSGTFICRDLTIEPNALVSIEGNAVLQISKPIVLQSNENSMAQLLDKGEHLIKTRIEKNISIENTNNFLSVPITNALASTFGNSSELSGNTSIIKSLKRYDSYSQKWESITNETNVMKPMEGYLFTSSANQNQKVIFTGNANTGIQYIGLEPGFNLIGNPYPVTIDFGDYSNQKGWGSAENINASIWTNTPDATLPTEQNIAVYNRLLGMGINGGTRNIKPTQSFWIYDQISSFITINNEAKISSNGNMVTDGKSTGLKIQVNQNNFTDETLIVFHPSANSLIDSYDSRKMMSSSVKFPQVFTKADQLDASINAIAKNYNQTIPVSIKPSGVGTVNLTFSEINGLFATSNTYIYFEDKLLNKIVNLKEILTYSFQAENSQLIENRFLFRIITNTNPQIVSPIENSKMNEDEINSFTIPVSKFTDLDFNDKLTFSALLNNGNALPAWLTFNSTTLSFSGKPGNSDVGTYTISIKAADKMNASISQNFNIEVININDSPILKKPIPNYILAQNESFSINLFDFFEDIDVGDVLTYQISSSTFSQIPNWLQMNTQTKTISGNAIYQIPDSITFTIKATDIAGASVSDEFYMKLINPTEIAENYYEQITCFPNPVNNKLSVNFGNQLNYNHIPFTVFDAYGRILRNGIIETNKNEIDCSLFPSGIIFIQFQLDKQKFTKKIIIN